MSTDSKTIARRYIENVMTNGDLSVAFELCSPSFQHHFPGSAGPIGREATEQLTRVFHAGFPDLHVTVEDQILEGSRVATRLTFQGTHRGAFQGIAATGKAVRFTGVNIAQIENARITELWSELDAAGLMQQIAPHAPPSRAH